MRQGRYKKSSHDSTQGRRGKLKKRRKRPKNVVKERQKRRARYGSTTVYMKGENEVIGNDERGPRIVGYSWEGEGKSVTKEGVVGEGINPAE